jgi:ketosteroid isomerase-like protein
MPAHTPAAIHRLSEAAFNAGDRDGPMALYEPGARLVPQPGQVVTGTEAIRAALAPSWRCRGGRRSSRSAAFRPGRWRWCTAGGR